MQSPGSDKPFYAYASQSESVYEVHVPVGVKVKLCALLLSATTLSDTRPLPYPGDYHDPETVPSLKSHYE
jgi:hypothetical protein